MMWQKRIFLHLSLPRFLLSTVLLSVLVLLAACNGSVPSPPNTTIYAVSKNGTVYAMNGKNGSIRWSQHMSGDNGSPWGGSVGLTLANNVIYTSSSVDGGYVYAFQAQTGTIIWHTHVHHQGLPSAPTVANGVVYFSVTEGPYANSYIYAFDGANGSLLWSTPINGWGASPEIVSASLYLSSSLYKAKGGPQPGFVYALNARNGSIRWQHQVSNTVFWQVVLNGVVYSDDGAAIYAFRADNGLLLWQKSMRADSLIARGNTLYVSVNSTLYALRASDGKQLWQVSIGKHMPYNLTVTGNTLYAVSFFDPGIYAFRTQDGAPLWNYQTQASSCGSFPIVDNGVVYFSMLPGTIYELAASNGSLIASYAITNSWLVTYSPLVVGQ